MKKSISLLLLSILAIILFSTQLSLFSINLYQKFISPNKGYNCAYATLYQNELSCSGYGKQVIKNDGFMKGFLLIKQRFDDCHNAANILSNSCSIIGKVQSGDDIPVECEKACNECNTGCSEGSGACFNELKSKIKKEVEKKVDKTKKEIKERIDEIIDNIKGEINNFFNDMFGDSSDGNTKDDSVEEDIIEKENIKNDLKTIIKQSKTIFPTSSKFDEIINKILEFQKNDYWGEVEEGNGNEYWEKLPIPYKVVVIAKLKFHRNQSVMIMQPCVSACQ